MCFYVIWRASLSQRRCELPSSQIRNNFLDVNVRIGVHSPSQLRGKALRVWFNHKRDVKTVHNFETKWWEVLDFEATGQDLRFLLFSTETSHRVLLVNNSLFTHHCKQRPTLCLIGIFQRILWSITMVHRIFLWGESSRQLLVMFTRVHQKFTW